VMPLFLMVVLSALAVCCGERIYMAKFISLKLKVQS
jgi:hypothetical protein